jgi:NitT/TauT family transport system permease protein
MKVSRSDFNLKQFFGKPAVRACLWIIALLIVWELVSRLGITPSYILPPFSKVLTTLWQELTAGNLMIMVGRSLLYLVEALGLGLGLAVLIILTCQKSKTFNSFYNTVSTIMNAIPSMALLPLIIMWFGVGNLAILVLVTHSVLWTFTIYVNEGISALPKIYRDFSDNIGLGVFRRVKDIFLPALLPNIVSGLKVIWARAWRSLIGAEIVFGAIGSAGGLGYFINISRLDGNMARVLGGVVVVAVIGILVDIVIFKRLNALLRKWGMSNE